MMQYHTIRQVGFLIQGATSVDLEIRSSEYCSPPNGAEVCDGAEFYIWHEASAAGQVIIIQ